MAERSSSFLTESVKNTGSAARDHLANERTFLAWARTGLAFLGAGTGVFLSYELSTQDRLKNQLHSIDVDIAAKAAAAAEALRSSVLPACLHLWFNGALVLGFSLHRYFDVQRALINNNFIVAKRNILLVILATTASTMRAIVILYDIDRDNAPRIAEQEGRRREIGNS